MTGVAENAGASLAAFGYAPTGERTSATMAGASTSLGYDGIGRLASLAHNVNDAVPPARDVSWAFTYNPASQLATQNRAGDAYAWTGHADVDRPYAANGLNQYSSAGGTSCERRASTSE